MPFVCFCGLSFTTCRGCQIFSMADCCKFGLVWYIPMKHGYFKKLTMVYRIRIGYGYGYDTHWVRI
ncbi:hypothetical protein RchiOBHm_Chr5g0076051 [Rosa chinensis]|uniref:Uncharacterized protein n=1 Tax=Rosa chinensis TaxID=74649 RepID=A0A2P6QLM6_ROSCH|nr:hypothetical protein RchiOBHm_Chr5g0076051 [Rosa chinensis]